MMRKIFVIVPAILVGLFAVGGLASAAAPYPPPPPVSVGANVAADANGNINIVVGSPLTFSGDGFDPLEGIGIDVTYGGTGLRSTSALTRVLAPTHVETSADANGHFDQALTLSQTGTATLTAVGHSSGHTASLVVQIVAVGSTTASGTTAVVAGGGSGAAGSGLAYTGASIAGPLVIGFVALFGGLSLLFFGTRGVRLRKSARASE